MLRRPGVRGKRKTPERTPVDGSFGLIQPAVSAMVITDAGAAGRGSESGGLARVDPSYVFFVAASASLVILSIILHEIAHGWVAYKCGDDTAYLMGRLTLNPLKHIDPFLTVLLPLMCILMGMPAFGGPKPVPVNPYRLRHPVRDERLVSLAGVVVNFALAFLFSQVLLLSVRAGVIKTASPSAAALAVAVVSNLVLFVFNLTPIPPLDGSRLLRSFLPWEARRVFNMLDQWGLFILFIVIQIPAFGLTLVRVIGFMWGRVLGMPGGLFPFRG